MERLQKVIARSGVASRRKAEQLITAGKVTVNGEVVRVLGTKVNPNKDKISVNGIPLEKEAPLYYLLYKPTGVISSVKDNKGRKVVTDFIETEARIFPVGRLDYDTSGLLLLTNDGNFAHLLTHPKHQIEKTYLAKVKGRPTKESLHKLRNGVMLEDGITAPAKVKLISSNKKTDTSLVRMTIYEGRNRQVRRMFEAVGHPVEKLKRERFAFLHLHGLNAGEYRELKPFEVKQLKELAVT